MGLAGSIHFILTVFFDALNEGEDPCQSRFDVGGEVHWIEASAGGAKLNFGFFADFGAGQQPVAGRGGGVVFLAKFAVYPLSFNEFHHGGEMIAKGQPGLFVELVDLFPELKIAECCQFKTLEFLTAENSKSTKNVGARDCYF